MKVHQSTLRAQNVPVVLEWKRRHPCWALREEHPVATKGRAEGSQSGEMVKQKRSRKRQVVRVLNALFRNIVTKRNKTLSETQTSRIHQVTNSRAHEAVLHLLGVSVASPVSSVDWEERHF